MLKAIIVLALIGVGVSSFALYDHYQITEVCGGWLRMRIPWLSCTTINRGVYSTVFHIPLAVFGIVGYGSIALAGMWVVRTHSRISLGLLIVLSTLALAVSLYLAQLSWRIYRAFCIFCLTSYGISFAIFVLMLVFAWRGRAMVQSHVLDG